ncbi:hypothetical protein F5X68DRAFT_53212 [Plectosphaerella plurivora]|uniref:Transcription factor domain-containing protein n=1 Tax=Plectosphaerella plurivora TaxID=936078 RepID=A0A9P8V1W0_9PEZI|nr:hypothetical protein F5X68DRAFT_53212 [Plectosphaerella plurivora]
MASVTKAVKFVESDPSGLPVKRKQVQQACESCRRRKKRCIHTESHDGDDGDVFRSPSLLNGRDGPNGAKGPEVKPEHTRRFVCDTNPEGMFAEAIGSDAAGKHASRFVCDTNPEGMFAEITRSDDARKPARNDEVGVWVPTSTLNQASSTAGLRPSIPYDSILIPYAREHCLTCMPPEKEFRQLKKIYYRKIHPIYNLIPESLLDGEDGPATIVLRQVISLAAATDPAMINNLKLGNQGADKLSFSEFSQALSGAIRTTLATSLIADRTINIRVLCMLSLYFQPSSIEESEVPAQFFAEAVHHSQTLGLHLLRTGDSALETLFCAVWAVDVINAAAYGRPRLFHERDFAADLDQCISRQEPCFRLWLSISRWLDQTISLYRPAASAQMGSGEFKPFIDLPVLEPMIVDANALEVPTFLIATLEVFYHAVIILSCRLPRPGAEGPDSTYASSIPPATANARRSLASERIASSVRREKLSPVPFVPYAVSLSLSVEYRKMRHSALPMFRLRAREAFRYNCELLKRSKDVFWSAKVTFGLGERMLREMERAATTMVREAPPTPQPSDPSPSEPTPDVAMFTPNMDRPGYLRFTDSLQNLDAMDMNLDVFGYLDPSFDLTMAENALEGNLDLGLPLNWGEWEQFGQGP